MRDKREFLAILNGIQGQDASEYSKLVGDFDFTRFVMHILRPPVSSQGGIDTIFVLHVPQLIAGFPSLLFKTPIRRTALEDFLARKVAAAIEEQYRRSDAGRPKSIYISCPGPQILPRSSVIVAQDYVEARISIHLPLKEGRVDAAETERIFFDDLPAIVNASLIYCYLDEAELNRFVDMMEDADHVRQSLQKRGMVSFIGQGSRVADGAPALSTPDESTTTMDVPNARQIRGLGIPAGITLIIGDSYSGRSDLIDALGAGIYNHIPGDGREHVISMSDAVQIVAEGSRSVQRVDVSPFLADREGIRARQFTSASATPAESQMASAMEAAQVGAQVLLFDEATSDPAFLTIDSRLGGLRPDAARNITPLSVRARQIADEMRVSLIIGAYASAAEFIPAADLVLYLENGRLTNITREAKGIDMPPRPAGRLTPLPAVAARTRQVIPSSIDPWLGQDDALIEALGTKQLRFGRYVIDLSAIPQLVDPGQTVAIGLLLYYAKLHYLDEGRTVAGIMDQLDQDLGTEGLDTLSRDLRGDLARPRRYEIAAALNRLVSLRIKQPDQNAG